MKDHIKCNTKAFNLTEVEQLAWEGIATVTAARWKKLIVHVQEKVEDHYWSCDGLYEQYVDRFIIPLGGESDSDDDDSVDSDDSESATETDSSEEDADCVSDSSECSCDEP